MTRVLVLGAAGSVGGSAVRDLVLRSTCSVIAADVRPVPLADLTPDLAARVSPVTADIEDDAGLGDLVAQADLVLNATAMRYAMLITRAAIDRRVHLVDLGTYHDTMAQLELSDAAAAARVCAVIGAGVCPGLTNLLARYGSEQLETVESVRIHSFLVNALYESPANVNDRLDATKLPGLVYRDGQLVETAPLAESEEVEFAEPYGRQWVHLMPHPETLTLPRYLGVRNVEFKTGYPADEEAVIRSLRDTGLAATEPFVFGDSSVAPRELVATVIGTGRRGMLRTANVKRVNVIGTQGGRRVHLAYDLVVEEERGSATSKITGTMAAIAATSVLAAGRPGIHPAEGGLEPAVVLRALAERGYRVTETRTTTGDVLS